MREMLKKEDFFKKLKKMNVEMKSEIPERQMSNDQIALFEVIKSGEEDMPQWAADIDNPEKEGVITYSYTTETHYRISELRKALALASVAGADHVKVCARHNRAIMLEWQGVLEHNKKGEKIRCRYWLAPYDSERKVKESELLGKIMLDML